MGSCKIVPQPTLTEDLTLPRADWVSLRLSCFTEEDSCNLTRFLGSSNIYVFKRSMYSFYTD